MKRLPEGKQERCASCGKFKGLSLYPPNSTDDAHLFCSECIRRLKEGERLYLVFSSEFEPPGPPEEGFSWLFKSARVLVSEGVSDEDQIIPTLVFAHEIDRGTAGGTAVASYRTDSPLVPNVWKVVKNVDGIVILEEELIQANILARRSPPDKRGEAIPQRVLIQVSFHKKVVKPEQVASVYAERLAAKGMRFGGADSGSIEYEFAGNRYIPDRKAEKRDACWWIDLPVTTACGSILPRAHEGP